SEESGVTYTDISSPFEELSDIGSPRANDHEYLMMIEDPYVEDPVDYPADEGDDSDDEEESSEDEEDDEMDVEADEE
nr:hypothetical protein [Tanacetum cinerariifolium]